MPKLRLREFIAEKSIKVADLNADIQDAIARVSAQENTLDKLNDEVAKDLRAISESLNVSIFDLFIPAEKFYRLKMIEYLAEPEYSGTPRKKLEKLHSKLPLSSKISLSLLGVYATQILPESLLTDSALKLIAKALEVNVSPESLKNIAEPPQQTISVESTLKQLGINLDELSILLEIPKKFIPWISTSPKKVATINPPDRIRFMARSESATFLRGVREGNDLSISEEYESNPICEWVCDESKENPVCKWLNC